MQSPWSIEFLGDLNGPTFVRQALDKLFHGDVVFTVVKGCFKPSPLSHQDRLRRQGNWAGSSKLGSPVSTLNKDLLDF